MLTVYLALKLQKPLLIEGPGVGKTGWEGASRGSTDRNPFTMLRGPRTKALYEWNYQRQLLRVRSGSALKGHRLKRISSPYLPTGKALVKAIRSPHRVVLLIDRLIKPSNSKHSYLRFSLISGFNPRAGYPGGEKYSLRGLDQQ